MPGLLPVRYDMKAIFSKLFHATDRISYRRLAAFCAATGLLFVDKLNGEQWVMVCICFIAGEAAPRMFAAFRG